MNNGTKITSQNQNVLDLIALIIAIISFFTCSSCFMLGIAGVVLSLLVLFDNKKQHNKTMGYVALSLSVLSIIFMIVIALFIGMSDSGDSRNNDNSNNNLTTTTSINETTTHSLNSSETTKEIIQETSTATTTQTTTVQTTTVQTTTVQTTTKALFEDELALFNSGEYKYITLNDLHKYSPNMAGEKVYLVDKVFVISKYSIGFNLNTSLNTEEFSTPDRDYSKIVQQDDTIAMLGVVGELDGIWGLYSVEFSNGKVFAKGDEALQYAKETSDSYFEQYFNVTESVVKYLGSEATLSDYKEICQQYDATDILRNPNNYTDRYCCLTGSVSQVVEGWFGSFTIYIEDSNGNKWECSYSYGSNESHLLEGDYVTVYGKLDGTTTAKTVLGKQVTMPKLEIVYIG